MLIKRWLLVAVCLGVFVLPVYATDPIAENVAKLGIAKEQLLKLGEAVYNTDGENTCLQCHGKGGTGGTQAGAADLRHPKTWRVYQALGGDEAFKKDKDKFVIMETVLHDLIRNGAPRWNLKFPREHKEIALDWSKVTIPDKADKYNQMMKGITSEPMAKKLKELQEQLDKQGKKLNPQQMRDLAAVSDFEYVKTFDDGSDNGGVFK